MCDPRVRLHREEHLAHCTFTHLRLKKPSPDPALQLVCPSVLTQRIGSDRMEARYWTRPAHRLQSDEQQRRIRTVLFAGRAAALRVKEFSSKLEEPVIPRNGSPMIMRPVFLVSVITAGALTSELPPELWELIFRHLSTPINQYNSLAKLKGEPPAAPLCERHLIWAHANLFKSVLYSLPPSLANPIQPGRPPGQLLFIFLIGPPPSSPTHNGAQWRSEERL